MRDLEALGADIDGYTLESTIRREVKYTRADIPDLERENKSDHARLAELNAKPDKTNRESFEAMGLMSRIDGRARLVRMLEDTKDRKGAYVLSVQNIRPDRDRDLNALERRIQAEWTIGEILFFKTFTTGRGDFTSSSGWAYSRAGYSAKTSEGQSNLERLFERLCRLIMLYAGALAYAIDTGAARRAVQCQDWDGISGMTLNALVKALPEKPSVSLADIAERLKNMEADNTATAINAAEARKDAAWLRKDRERRIREGQKRGRDNQRKGEKNGNGRKTDPKLKNQIKTEVRQTKENNPAFSTSDACAVVARKHLKVDGKTPIYSKRTIENWMSNANAKTKKP